jgi:hypothetical protein
MGITVQELRAKLAQRQEAAAELQALFESLFPLPFSPEYRQYYVWLDMYSVEVVVAGLQACGKWYNQHVQDQEEAEANDEEYTPDVKSKIDIMKYASACMRTIKAELEKKHASRN